MVIICKNLLNQKTTPVDHLSRARDAQILAEDAVRRGDLPGGEYIISYHGKKKEGHDWGMTYPESLNKTYGQNTIYISRVDGQKVFESVRGNKSSHVSIFTEFPTLKDRYSYSNTL
jgi:hypothetical protein